MTEHFHWYIMCKNVLGQKTIFNPTKFSKTGAKNFFNYTFRNVF